MTDVEKVHLAPFDAKIPIALIKYPNGGWVVQQNGRETGLMGQNLGAFSNTKDMLLALNEALAGSKSDEPQG